ncbi:phage head-tail adaptor, putative, SPP1 family [Xaviernesmea oryzae]|uniref:Phage head-tail adaptor, putative, SPP1 family n=1 Tax=Xaviernesmea oryzae TaxID=464029 RepID=A0A1X7FBB4_9HYPH|nr:phage head closure protein [Xaviernesmea oryzae]SMF48934.1 phage head-tail adaptor, putative, SPP1 family [Xaviernesmea oryzae]
MVVFFDPGQMTARLDLEAPQAEPDGQGGATVTWQVVASLWARIEPVSFVVAEEAAAESGRISHRIWVRFREDIVAGQRFRKGARVFVVRLVRDPDETGRYLVCQCEEEAR